MKNKKNLERQKQIKFRVNDREYELIKQKFELSGATSMRVYLTRMALYGYLVEVDLSELNQFSMELNRIGVNLNQITKKAHQTGNIYQEDIQDLVSEFDKISNNFYSLCDTLNKLIESELN